MNKIKVILLCISMCTVLFACGRNTEEYFSDEKETTATESRESVTEVTSQTETESESEKVSEDAIICIYICGCVREPGVYEFSKASRICDAIERAGGFTEDADVNFWNQAMAMEDGMMIYIPSKEENLSPEEATGERSGEVSSQKDGLVNINTADKATLITLPGIGETRAERIISYRQENGNFASIEEITRVSGIGDSLFEKIREYITVH